MPNLAIVLGTSRADGNTHALVRSVAAQSGAMVFDLAERNITGFDYAHDNRNDDFLPLMRDLVGFDHIALASPIYWYSPSTPMKTFMDRFSDLLEIEIDLGRQLRGKHASVIATCLDDEVTDCFEAAFANTFNFLGMTHKGMLLCVTEDSYTEKHQAETIASYLASIK